MFCDILAMIFFLLLQHLSSFRLNDCPPRDSHTCSVFAVNLPSYCDVHFFSIFFICLMLDYFSKSCAIFYLLLLYEQQVLSYFSYHFANIDSINGFCITFVIVSSKKICYRHLAKYVFLRFG